MDAQRRKELAATVVHPSELRAVADAIALLGARAATVYVERHGSMYRWSIAHRGGPYPVLREVARFLDLPHDRVLVHVVSVDDWSVVAPARDLGPPDARAFIEPGSDAEAILAQIEAALHAPA